MWKFHRPKDCENTNARALSMQLCSVLGQILHKCRVWSYRSLSWSRSSTTSVRINEEGFTLLLLLSLAAVEPAKLSLMKKYSLLAFSFFLCLTFCFAQDRSNLLSSISTNSKLYYEFNFLGGPTITRSINIDYYNDEDFDEIPLFIGPALDLYGIFGYQFSPLFRCGIGTGLNFLNLRFKPMDFDEEIRSISFNFISLPIFLQIQSRLLQERKLSPIVELLGGYKIPLQYGKLFGLTSNYCLKGAYFEPSVGISYYVHDNIELKVSLYGTFRVRRPINLYQINYNSFGVKLGVIL